MAGAVLLLFSVSICVMAPISASQWAPLTCSSSPIFCTSSSQPRKPRYSTLPSAGASTSVDDMTAVSRVHDQRIEFPRAREAQAAQHERGSKRLYPFVYNG